MNANLAVIADNLDYLLWGRLAEGQPGGVALTLLMAIGATLLALPGGIALAGLAWRYGGLVRRLLFLWAEIIRGIPLIFVIFWLWYLLPMLTGGEVSMEPVVVMDTILVVRPREVQFKWSFDKVAGTVSNTGNTWFKLLIKPGCDSTEEEGNAWYLRPWDVVRQPALRQPGNHYLVYNDKFIKISDTCPLKPRPAE